MRAKETSGSGATRLDVGLSHDKDFSAAMRSQCGQGDQVGAMAPKFQPGLALLIDAAKYAKQTSGDLWEFAVEIYRLLQLGLTENDLRFLVRLEYVDHGSEVTVASSCGRQFRPTGDLYFTRRTCFILTPMGFASATGQGGLSPTALRCAPIRLHEDAKQNGAHHVPSWDVDRHTLTFDGRIVKQFKRHAVNQEIVLSAFQEEGWPERIDDPLAPSPTLVSKRRLCDTIKCLNRRQEHKLIYFRGDGTGEGVIWESATEHRFHGGEPERVA
jgi:hypothetical protein